MSVSVLRDFHINRRPWNTFPPMCSCGMMVVYALSRLSEGFYSCDRLSNLTLIGFKSSLFQPCHLDWWPRKIIRHLFYITSSFVHHLKPLGEFELQLLSGNAQFGSKSMIFLPRVTLKFNGWPWKTIGILFYVTVSFVHHFKAIGEFKLKLQSGNAQFRPKWAIFCPVWH